MSGVASGVTDRVRTPRRRRVSQRRRFLSQRPWLSRTIRSSKSLSSSFLSMGSPRKSFCRSRWSAAVGRHDEGVDSHRIIPFQKNAPPTGKLVDSLFPTQTDPIRIGLGQQGSRFFPGKAPCGPGPFSGEKSAQMIRFGPDLPDRPFVLPVGALPGQVIQAQGEYRSPGRRGGNPAAPEKPPEDRLPVPGRSQSRKGAGRPPGDEPADRPFSGPGR